MLDQEREKLRAIKTFPSLVKYLRDELDWPIETDDFNEIVFDYEAEELGIDPETAVKIDEIKQLRPLVSNQPWGIFFIKFQPKRLPVVVLRRILSRLVFKKRASANKSEHASWNLDDLLFISNYGEDEQRQITFAHFSQDKERGDLPTLKVLGWDDADTALHLDHCHQELKGKLHWPDDERNLKDWCEKWSSVFILRHREVITTSKDLAMHLADLAKRIRSRANRVLAIETERGHLRKLYKSFQEALIHDLSEDDFADMYAQTIAYGLLAARVSRPMGVTADNAADMVPITNPFLKEMLGTFLTAGGRKGAIDFDELGVQEVVELLNSPDTHMNAILRDFGNRKQQEDPVIHFYEDFLSEYDKKKKVQRGVFFTPQPVVSYIVRSVHELLQNEFGLEDGLAAITTWGEMVKRKPDIKIPVGVSPDEPFVQILDPATGTATFLVEVIDIIHKTMRAKWIKQGHMALETQSLWNEYVFKHLLPRLYGFELMMAPYAIAHMKLGLKLYETGYTFNADERVHVYLTNSLEPASDSIPERVFEQWAQTLAHEARAVNTIKSHKRFTIIIGNPPYAAFSSNRSVAENGELTFIGRLIEDYKYIDGNLVEEKKWWLQDDYVKFIRFAQWMLSQSNIGVLGMITNHSYLDNPTFRGMRWQLLKAFSNIFVQNLHGNIKTAGEEYKASKDQNVFDIRQGVSIILGIFASKRIDAMNIRYSHMLGTREMKYERLSNETLAVTKWVTLSPQPVNFMFIPQNLDLEAEYSQYERLNDVFLVKSVGFVTARDALTIAEKADELWKRIQTMKSLSPEAARAAFNLGKDSRDWKVEFAQNDLSSSGPTKSKIVRVCYRPFDIRFTYYTGQSRGFIGQPQRKVMRQLIRGNNIALITTRQQSVIGSWALAFVSNLISESSYISNKTAEINYVFPLWILKGEEEGEWLWNSEERITNLTQPFLRKISQICKSADTHSPEEIFQYIYAVFNSTNYRKRYTEFLKTDFPRLPLTFSLELFRELSRLGGELVAFHLMESPRLNTLITKWHGSTPSNEVEKVTYSNKTVWIDKEQTEGFRGVPENVWNFQIGSYQVCEKWLKDRKGRVLSAEDITHYQKIVVALNETIRLMKEIDDVIEQHGGWPGAFEQDQ